MTVANVSIVIGQSNAISFSTLGVAYPGGWTTQSLGGGYAEASWTGSTWAQYVPGSTSYGSGSEWGPEATLSLAKRLQTPQVTTYIYKYAVGGVGLEGGWWPFGGSTYNAFVADLSTALGQLTGFGLTPVLKECFWIGNESDTFSWSNASAVGHDLPALVAKIRAAFTSPNMKFVIARTKSDLGSSIGPLPYVEIVRSAQTATAVDVPRCAWVNCDDLPSSTVSVGHYDPSAILTLGTRLFTAAEAIT